MGIADLPPDPPTDLQGPPLPALVSGTSSEFLGKKPLPRSIRDRQMVFILGPTGVGKSCVALALAGTENKLLSESDVLDAINHHVRNREWQSGILEAPALVIESPCFLNRRPAALEGFQDLVRRRAGGGRRTWVVEAKSGSSMENIMAAVHPGYRATLLLRFPVGRGRLRFAKRICDELGIAGVHARSTVDLEPWTYERVQLTLAAQK